jgi:hypothetical protein
MADIVGTDLTGGLSVVLPLCKNYTSARKLLLSAALLPLTFIAAGCVGSAVKQQAQQTQTPQISLSASTFNFSTVVIGQNTTQTIKISNPGTGPLQIATVSVSNNAYTISGPAFPVTIQPAASAAYTLTFAPTSAGTVTATMDITSNAAPNLASVALSGVGEKAFANLVVTPAVISFGNLALKATSTQNVTLQNTGDVSLSVQGVTISGAGFGYSDLSPGFSLAPNQSVTFQVWFSPKVAGAAAATLTLLSANIASPETVSMSGDGVSTTTPPPTNPPPTNPPPAQHSVALNWNASTSQVVGYRVYRGETAGGSYTALTSSLSALTYTDSTVSAGTTYYYVVTAVDSSGVESSYSNQVTAVIPSS